MTGVLLAAATTSTRRASLMPTLRTLNPFVTAALACFSAARQTGPVPAVLGSEPAAGATSSFGMSGVNAAALLSAPTGGDLEGAGVPAAQPWQLQAVQPLPACHAWVRPGPCVGVVLLRHAGASALEDCSIHGQKVLVLGGGLEILAAGCSMHFGAGPEKEFALRNVTAASLLRWPGEELALRLDGVTGTAQLQGLGRGAMLQTSVATLPMRAQSSTSPPGASCARRRLRSWLVKPACPVLDAGAVAMVQARARAASHLR